MCGIGNGVLFIIFVGIVVVVLSLIGGVFVVVESGMFFGMVFLGSVVLVLVGLILVVFVECF